MTSVHNYREGEKKGEKGKREKEFLENIIEDSRLNVAVISRPISGERKKIFRINRSARLIAT